MMWALVVYAATFNSGVATLNLYKVESYHEYKVVCESRVESAIRQGAFSGKVLLCEKAKLKFETRY